MKFLAIFAVSNILTLISVNLLIIRVKFLTLIVTWKVVVIFFAY